MGTKRGRVPENNELSSLLEDLSNRLYRGEWSITFTTYDNYRRQGWALAKRILGHHRLPATSEGWATLVGRLKLKPVITLEEVRRRNGKQMGLGRWTLPTWIDEPSERLGESEWRQARMVSERMVMWEGEHGATGRALTFVSGHGMHYIARWMEIRRWCPRRHQYVLVGKQAVLEVR